MKNNPRIIFKISASILFGFVAVFGRPVKSFDEMKDIEKYEELTSYGLVPPGETNQLSGKKLILLALKANSFQKGNWVMAHGLLGVSMLNVSVYDRAGYESLFLSLIGRSKYFTSLEGASEWAWIKYSGEKFEFVDTKSVIVKRENLIGFLTWELNNRFVFDKNGKYGRVYQPDPGRKTESSLYTGFRAGLKLFSEFKSLGMDDKCLNNLLGITIAVLKYDGFHSDKMFEEELKINQPIQIFTDALAATITTLKELPSHSKNFLEELYWQTESRGIGDRDTFLFPMDEKEVAAIQKLVSFDLDRIEIKEKRK